MTETIFWTMCAAETRLPPHPHMVENTAMVGWSEAGAPDFLSALEQRRLEGLRFPKRRREWLLGRWTMKKLLQSCCAECVGLPLAQIEIGAEAGGAPYLAQPNGGVSGGSISISHRENAAACAYAPHLRVGVDLEQVEPRSEAFVRDFFTQAEALQALALSGAARERETALIWGAKESALKALRTGLRLDTRAVEIVRTSQPGLDGWGEIEFGSQLVALQGARGWWRMDGARVLTLVVLEAWNGAVNLKFVPVG